MRRTQPGTRVRQKKGSAGPSSETAAELTRKKNGVVNGCSSFVKQRNISALCKAHFHPSILCCFEQICPVTWRNIKAINLRCGRSKQRLQRLVIIKKKKKKLPAVISWLLKLALGGWQNGFIPGWLWEDTKSIGVYCVLIVPDDDTFAHETRFVLGFFFNHTGSCCWLFLSLRWCVSLSGDTSLRLRHKKTACILSAIFLNIICRRPFLSVCPSWFTPPMHA